MKYHRIVLLTAACLLLLFPGCGSSRRHLPVAYVEGTVTHDGVPLENASINFIPKIEGQGEAAGGYTDAKGKYKVTSMNGDVDRGALPGDYIVTISKVICYPKPGVVVPEGEVAPEITEQITPLKYKSSGKSPLSATIVKGKNTLDFDVKGKP